MSELFIGLMSGTSMDGIDAALLDLSGGKTSLIATHCKRYPEPLQSQIETALRLQDPRTADLDELDALIGDSFADAVSDLLGMAGIRPDQVIAIGSHGQTIRHEPNAAEPYSLQLGNPPVISTRTGIDTVADFRTADIAAGGQGAPLVPAFHRAVFANRNENRVIVNIGGIANITVLPANTGATVTGFDTGPGNTLMDIWVRRHLGEGFDHEGAWAASGKVEIRLLAAMLQDSYFSISPPKSTGREYFNRAWLTSYLQGLEKNANDVQATLCELTAVSITDAIEKYAPATQRVLVCGGGAQNNHLMTRLRDCNPGIPVTSTLDFGIHPDWVEAAAFAWLAKQHLEGKPGNIPEVTGASRPVVLGRLFKHP